MTTILQQVDGALVKQDDTLAVELMELLAQRGELSDSDRITLGIVLFLPPFGDAAAAIQQFEAVADSELCVTAAIWGAYVVDMLYPVTENFHEWLKLHPTPEAAWCLARHARVRGESAEVRRWLMCIPDNAMFSNALVLSSQYELNPLKRDHLIVRAKSLTRVVTDPAAELPRNRAEVRSFYWASLIRGEVVTKLAWEDMFGEYV